VRFETSAWESRAFSRKVFKFDDRLNILENPLIGGAGEEFLLQPNVLHRCVSM